MAARERSSLADLAAQSGAPVPCAGNLPLDLGDPGFAWFIERGAVDLFLVESRDGVEQSAPQHVLRANAGRLLPGVAPQEEDTTLGLIVKGLPGTVLRQLPLSSLADIANAELAAQVDAWLADVSVMLSRGIGHRPRPDALVEPGEAVAATQGTLSARRGVVWVSAPPPGTGLFLSLIDPVESGPDGGAAPGAIPLTSTSWLTLMDEVQLSARSSEALADENVLLAALANFHATAFALERLNRRLAVVDQANLERARATNRRADEEGARHRLFDLYGLSRADDAGAGGSSLLESLAIIGRHEGIDFRWPARPDTSEHASKPSNAWAERPRWHPPLWRSRPRSRPADRSMQWDSSARRSTGLAWATASSSRKIRASPKSGRGSCGASAPSKPVRRNAGLHRKILTATPTDRKP